MKPQPKEIMGQLAAISGGGGESGESGDTTKKANSFAALNSNHLKDVVNNLEPLAKEKNKIIDMNSMMEALDDYVQQAREAKCGVPINFYLSFIDKRAVAKMVLDKYEPDWNNPEKKRAAEEAKDDKDPKKAKKAK